MAIRPQPKTAAKRNRKNKPAVGTQWRFYVAVSILFSVFSVLVARAAYIQVISPERYSSQGDMRSLRSASLSVQRGMIVDRNGRELAVSVPVETVWADPQRIAEANALSDTRRWQALAETFRMNREELVSKVSDPERRFVYLQRKVTPSEADYLRQLNIPGVYLKTESRRYYPTGEISAHLLGLTNIDGQHKSTNQCLRTVGIKGPTPTLEHVDVFRSSMPILQAEGREQNHLTWCLPRRSDRICHYPWLCAYMCMCACKRERTTTLCLWGSVYSFCARLSPACQILTWLPTFCTQQ